MEQSNFTGLFIDSRDNKSRLYNLENGQVRLLLNLPLPEISKYAISETGWICAIKIKRRRRKRSFVYCIKINENYNIIDRFNIKIPQNYHVTCLALKDNTVFIGGHNSNRGSVESADFIDLGSENKELQPIIIPQDYEMTGKAIDDILILDERMILVDNFIYPKYLFEYDITDIKKPELNRVIDLPNNGTYERIRSAMINRKRIAIFSTSMGMGGSRRHLNILSSKSLINYGTISSIVPMSHEKKAEHLFHDYILSGNSLYLACGRKGLGSVKLVKGVNINKVAFCKLNNVKDLKKIIYINENILVIVNDKQELQTIDLKELKWPRKPK